MLRTRVFGRAVNSDPTARGELAPLSFPSRAHNYRLREEFWDSALEPDELTEFDRMLEHASKAIEFLRQSAPWQLEAVRAGCPPVGDAQVIEEFAGAPAGNAR